MQVNISPPMSLVTSVSQRIVPCQDVAHYLQSSTQKSTPSWNESAVKGVRLLVQLGQKPGWELRQNQVEIMHVSA